MKNRVDNLIRKDRTFRLSANGIERLAAGKRMVVTSSRGLAYGPESPFASCDHLTPWVDDIFGFIGIDEIDHIVADDLEFAGPDTAAESMALACKEIASLVDAW